jgi:hypothetical protein
MKTKNSNSSDLISFKVYTRRRTGQYFVINIHPTKQAMHEYCRLYLFREGEDYLALCSGYERYKPLKKGGEIVRKHIGEINFFRGFLTAEAISHEATHAALYWARRSGLSKDAIFNKGEGDRNVSADEEKLCYVQGRIAQQITNKVWKHNLVKKVKKESV